MATKIMNLGTAATGQAIRIYLPPPNRPSKPPPFSRTMRRTMARFFGRGVGARRVPVWSSAEAAS